MACQPLVPRCHLSQGEHAQLPLTTPIAHT